ncbi:MAG TPA: M20/M25/M40 family metallo-hydrolase, partial [Gemmatimonadales bacterium]|nr:M20/M25/M40 family metallo-hydrolase [Gemmatimonadales bacterium]
LPLLLLTTATRLPAQATVDTTGVGQLIARAIGQSDVMNHLQHLTDVIGPRLSGTAAMRRANDWTAERLRGYGLTTTLEPYTFGVTWERGPLSLTLLEPFRRPITGFSWAWTAGTGGRAVTGPVVLADLSTRDSFALYRARVAGAWVLPKPAAPLWNPDGPPMTAADSARLAAALAVRASLTADTSAPAVEARRQWQIDLPYLLKQAGALGTLADGAKEHALMTMSGSPNRVSPLPNIVIAREDYAQLERLIGTGVTPRVEGRVDNHIGRAPVQQWNTVGEIRGSELPGQVVILGAHLDSWDLATGTTDNAAGSSVVIEAARLIAASGVKPKRTMRFILFSGEEQGLLGARAYAAAHAGEADSIQAVLVVDNGTGAIVGQALQGRADLEETWKSLLAPVASLGASTVRHAMKNGTDHLAFTPYGVPAFNFDQLPRGYGHTHHSQSDTFDKAVEEDLRQASTVMAVTGWQLANLPTLLPRGPRSAPERIPNRPSPAVAGGK